MSLQSPALLRSLHVVAERVSQNKGKTVRANTDAWLDENEKVHESLWNFIETGMMEEILQKSSQAKLARSCTKIGLVPDTIRRTCLRRANAAFTAAMIRLAATKDPKVKQKLFQYHLNVLISFPMRGGMLESQFLSACEHRSDICGQRLRYVIVDPDGKIDWGRCGIYLFANTRRCEEGEWNFLEREQQSQATHIVHRFANQGVSLESMGVTAVDEQWYITKNWPEEDALLCNGRRLKCDLWCDFKEMAFFHYTERLKEKYPDSPWLTIFGQKARAAAKAEIKAAEDARTFAKQAMEKKQECGHHVQHLRRGEGPWCDVRGQLATLAVHA